MMVDNQYITSFRDNGFPPNPIMVIVFVLIFLFLWAMLAKAEVYNSETIADAIFVIEGGIKAKKPYGILSVPCHTEQSCRKVCLNTIENNFTRWQSEGSQGDFLVYLASRYAPIGAKNDPSGLNRNWLRNLKAIMGGKK